ncbi:Metal dependent phosphohydrolase [Planctomycetales bacterium 10988]|nr:Metal dependent phosphohydrolase [Planctomycetales bacterium 10988]
MFYGHSLPGKPQNDWEKLEDHLSEVASAAEKFAEAFQAGPWGELIGRWHDLGKYSDAFQKYILQDQAAHIETTAGKVDHSTAGAKWATVSQGQQEIIDRILSHAIAAHHTGLLNSTHEDGSEGSLEARLKKPIPEFEQNVPQEIGIRTKLAPPGHLRRDPKEPDRFEFQLSLFTRMLFSCLVDADFLRTEAFYDQSKTKSRQVTVHSFEHWADALELHFESFKPKPGEEQSEVNRVRAEVLKSCLSAADFPPGLFSLTVPTGGGKTLASLAFAFRHAKVHPDQNFRKVIFAIPFTSIIEQTARVYREAFPNFQDQILEHHSNFDSEKETPWSRLAAENWDAPLVVTTNVQFFESFFARKTSRCRKLHRVARSVIILDETQTLPVKYLDPCLSLLRELAFGYGCTIVFCTATQPAINQRKDFPIGLEEVREIIPEPKKLYRQLKRVKTELLGQLLQEQLIERLIQEEQTLCVVNSRQLAAGLFAALEEKQGENKAHFHLSTRMCAAHREAVLADIRNRLKDGLPCRVISTQLIEAGVDVDFPAVYRMLAGLDSIAQAAGRCNREGKRPFGKVYLFELKDAVSPKMFDQAISHTKEVLPDFPDDPLCLEAIEQYFQLHYWGQSSLWKKSKVMKALQVGDAKFQFRDADENFRFIDETGQPVLVNWDEDSEKLINQLRSDTRPDWRIQRKLQRYVVNVEEKQFRAFQNKGDINLEPLHDQYFILDNKNCYDEKKGLNPERAGIISPESSII